MLQDLKSKAKQMAKLVGYAEFHTLGVFVFAGLFFFLMPFVTEFALESLCLVVSHSISYPE